MQQYDRRVSMSVSETTLPATPGPVREQPPLMRLPLSPPSRFIAWSLLLMLGFLALDVASSVFWIGPVPVKPWNPQVGLAIAFVCAGGVRYAMPLVIATLIDEMTVRNPGNPLGQQIGAALAMAFALTLTGLALRRRMPDQGPGSVGAVRDFLLIGAAGAGLAGLLYVGTHAFFQGRTLAAFLPSVLHEWLGNAAGLVVITPLLLLVLSQRESRDVALQYRAAWLDAVLFVVALAGVVYLLFGVGADGSERLFYLLFVPLIVLAMRHGFAGAAVGIATVQVAIIAAVWLAGEGVEDAAVYQMLMLVLGVTTLVLGAVAGERSRALAALARRSAELRAQQQALADAMRVAAASETASTMAHEMSQPLSAIGTYARAGMEMLRRGGMREDEIAKVLERIGAESTRTRDTVQRIREFFRTGIVRREPVHVGRVVVDAVEAMRDRLRAESIELATEVPAELPLVSADAIQIGTVLHNLIGNAIDALVGSRAPRWIRVVARQRGQFIDIEVVDGGPGIDASVRDVLFEPLATTKPRGMGLGLPISRTLVHAHGGRLELAAMHPTTFRISLPIHGHVSA
jgi:signal transduction histidine kinase